MHIETKKIQGKDIRYSSEGEGNTLILLHGFIERIEIWENFSKILSKTNRVICIELPGHGASELISDIQTMELMADHIHLLILELGLKDFVMIGHSMGGYIALAYAEKYPSELKGLGLFHSNAFADSADSIKTRTRTIEIIGQNREGFIFQFIPNLFASSNVEAQKTNIAWLQEGAKNMTTAALVSCLKGMMQRTDKSPFLSTTSLPLMFILGQEDSRSPIQPALQQTLLANHAEILILRDCGHMGYFEKPAETVNFVAAFTKNANQKETTSL